METETDTMNTSLDLSTVSPDHVTVARETFDVANPSHLAAFTALVHRACGSNAVAFLTLLADAIAYSATIDALYHGRADNWNLELRFDNTLRVNYEENTSHGAWVYTWAPGMERPICFCETAVARAFPNGEINYNALDNPRNGDDSVRTFLAVVAIAMGGEYDWSDLPALSAVPA